MLCLQLFAIFVVLTFSDGAMSSNLKCEYQKGSKFCKDMKSAYRQNVETQYHMSVYKFSDAMTRLTTANKAVREVLKTKEKEALLEPLRRALDYESSALFEVYRKCIKELTKSPCSIIFRGVFDATIKLVEAAQEIADGKKKEKIQALYDAFKTETNQSEKAHSLATKVLEALQ